MAWRVSVAKYILTQKVKGICSQCVTFDMHEKLSNCCPGCYKSQFTDRKQKEKPSSLDRNENFFSYKLLQSFPAHPSKEQIVALHHIANTSKDFTLLPLLLLLLPLTHPYTEACPRRDNNISFRVLLKTYQHFLSLTPNQAEGTRSTSYALLSPPGLSRLSCPAAGPKTGGKEEEGKTIAPACCTLQV